MSLADELLKRVLDKSDKQDLLNAETSRRINKLDKDFSIYKTTTSLNIDQLFNKIDDHPLSCPINKDEVRRIAIEEYNKILNLEKTKNEKVTVVSFLSKMGKVERIFLWLAIFSIVAYFILDKLNII